MITDVLPGLLAELRGQYDYLILLSHLGITMDKYLANEFKELNLIIGSHTHHLLENGLVVNQSMLAAAGKWGRYIGDIRLEFDVNHQLVQQQVNTVKTADLQTLPGDAKEIAGYVERGEALLAHEHVATLPASYAAKKNRDGRRAPCNCPNRWNKLSYFKHGIIRATVTARTINNERLAPRLTTSDACCSG